ncbi:GntR family transcriptional regulator [Alteribacillus sp. JSM 102045]|uniref:GntR family transcriptional regulator n=1 Tax=Alteribacillus sp. JSM 102045 TaxID=1562101 RepID=UPI0035C1C19C
MVSGELSPGTRLIEEKNAKETGISRSPIPIRKATRRLTSEGLVVVNPEVTSFVHPKWVKALSDAVVLAQS